LGSENWFEIGVGQLKAREFESAIQAFSRVVETLTDDFEAYNNRGVAYSQLNQFDLAIADFNRALTLKPDYAAARLNRGISHRRKGRVAAAIEDYRTLIQVSPDYVKAYQNLSWILATCPDGRFRDGLRALSLLQKAQRYTPPEPMADNWAAAWAEIGDFSKAVQLQGQHLVQIKGRDSVRILSEEQYWLGRYEKGLPRRDHYLVSDNDAEADTARKWIAELVPQPDQGPEVQSKAPLAAVSPPQPIPAAEKTPLSAAAAGVPHQSRFSVQVGSYARIANALEIVAALENKGQQTHAFKVILNGDRTWYRVLVGHYPTAAEARAAALALQRQDFPGAFELPTRYGLTLADFSTTRNLPLETRNLLLTLGFYPYRGAQDRWLIGAYGRKAEARAVVDDLAAAGVRVKLVKF
jgi:tetratricopeptide (TPR) repeat protein